jgi:hypothetical protein
MRNGAWASGCSASGCSGGGVLGSAEAERLLAIAGVGSRVAQQQKTEADEQLSVEALPAKVQMRYLRTEARYTSLIPAIRSLAFTCEMKSGQLYPSGTGTATFLCGESPTVSRRMLPRGQGVRAGWSRGLAAGLATAQRRGAGATGHRPVPRSRWLAFSAAHPSRTRTPASTPPAGQRVDAARAHRGHVLLVLSTCQWHLQHRFSIAFAAFLLLVFPSSRSAV